MPRERGSQAGPTTGGVARPCWKWRGTAWLAIAVLASAGAMAQRAPRPDLPRDSEAIGSAWAKSISPMQCAGEAPVEIVLRVDPNDPRTSFEGFGTALAWFANVTGGYPDPVRNRLADMLYGRDGLGWTIARYNIGGGNAAGTPPYLRAGAAVPGFWRLPSGRSAGARWRADDPLLWDWSADAGQRWWLDAIRERVPARSRIFEAFSNSPPWFMTVSGRVSGAREPRQDNLRAGQETRFAQYLAMVVEQLQQRHAIAFRTLSPVNEPNTPYWFAKNTQEGSHWSEPAQERMVRAADQALRERGLAIRIAAMDETNSLTFLRNWASYQPATRAVVAQLNVHSYDIIGQTAVRDVAATSGLRLWMSEADLSPPNVAEDFDDMASALTLAERITQDLKRLEPSAWVFWQAIENLSARKPGEGSNWGLIKMDLAARPSADPAIHVTRKYWAMANFSRYLRPGFRLLRIDDADTVAALSPDRRELVLVHVNAGLSARRLIVPADSLPGGSWSARSVVTSHTHRSETLCRSAATHGPQSAIAPRQSVTTVVLTRD